MLAPLLIGIAAQAAPQKIGIFDLAQIRATPLQPQVVSKTESGGVITEEIRFTSQAGIRVFGYLCYPKGGKSLPTNITIRNTGADARRAQAQLGFVEWSISSPEGNSDTTRKLTVGGARYTEEEQFTADPMKSWIYQHVVAQVRGLDYLATRPEVDMKRVVVNGFSWSGYTAALMHAVDNRPVCYVTWNSTGYFADSNGMSGDRKSRISRRMYEMYAPSYYAQYGTQPIFVGNALTDYFATLDGAIEMYRKLKSPKRFVFAPNRYHADTSRSEYQSSGDYMWTYQGGGPKTPVVNEGTVKNENGKLVYRFSVESSEKPVRAEVMYSFGSPGRWTGRSWHRKAAVPGSAPNTYQCELPVYDTSVPLYAVAQIETKSFKASANCPQYVDVPRLSIPAATATYPKMLHSFEDRSDLYFGTGTPTFISDAAEGKFAAAVEPFPSDGTIHLMNIEPRFWRGGQKLIFWLKGDNRPGPVRLYLTRDTNYYLDREGKDYVLFDIVKPGETFAAKWTEYQIPLSAIPDLTRVDTMYFEAPGRKLLIDGVRWE